MTVALLQNKFVIGDLYDNQKSYLTLI